MQNHTSAHRALITTNSNNRIPVKNLLMHSDFTHYCIENKIKNRSVKNIKKCNIKEKDKIINHYHIKSAFTITQKTKRVPITLF